MRVLIFAKGKKAGSRFFLMLCMLLSLAAHVIFIQFFQLLPWQQEQSSSSLQQCFYVDGSLQPALAGFAASARMRSSLPLYTPQQSGEGLDVEHFHQRLDDFSVLGSVKNRALPYGFENNWLDQAAPPVSLGAVNLHGFERSFVGNDVGALEKAELQPELMSVQGELGLAQFISFEGDTAKLRDEQWLGKSARFLLTIDQNGTVQSVFMLQGSLDEPCDAALQKLLQGSKWEKSAAGVRSAVIEIGWKGKGR